MSSPLAIKKGVSESRDCVEAARQLHAALVQPDIKLALFYCSPDYDLPRLAAELQRLFGDINLIGCTTAGEITPQGYLEGSLTGVSVASADMDASTLLLQLDPMDSASIGSAVEGMLASMGAKAGLPPSSTDTFAFMLIDGLAMQEELVVSCVHQQLRGIELVGGSAADGVRFGSTHIYFQGQFHRNVAILMLVRTGRPFATFRTQHFVHSGTRMVVTRADPANRIVYEINAKPAAREFARLIKLQITELTPLIFASHPVVVKIGGQYFVRSIAKVNEDESLTFFCAIDEGIVLTIAQGVDMVSNLETAFEQVRSEIGEPQLVLGCDCILRRLETERSGIKERIGSIFAANNVIGFATYGEQYNAMHVNQTFTGVAIGR